ncbi:MAG: enoyl-CoA hydratase [Burkholderiales bacterium]
MNDRTLGTQGQLIARKVGAIGWIVMSNPAKRNALTFEMWRGFPAILQRFAEDPAIRLVVLTGEGDSAFAAGADISQFGEKRSHGDALKHYNQTLQDATQSLLEFPKPLIAKIHGACVGGGLALALDCDLRFCSDDAMFLMPAGRLGLGYELGGIERMVQAIGSGNACDLFFSARKINAAEAMRMGVVNQVFAKQDFEFSFTQYCNQIAANAPLTLAAAKRAMRELAKPSGQRDLALVKKMYDACFQSQDYAEGRSAFLEKRAPRFSGK